MNQEIGVLIEILSEKLEIIQLFLNEQLLTNAGYEKMSLEVRDLDVAFLNYFNQIKSIHGKDVFSSVGVFRGDEIVSLQKVINETQSAEALVLEKKSRDEFEVLKKELNRNRDVSNRIKKYR